MISKILTGHSFGPACSYIVNKNGAMVLATEGVRNYNSHKMAEDFVVQQQLHPEKKKACLHAILSFYPGEEKKLNDEKMLEIAKRYLEELGVKNTQYAIARHTDRNHPHVHIIANLVNNDGKVIDDNWIGLRGKKITMKLTEQYGLTPANRKNLKLLHSESLNQSDRNRYKIYKAILSNLRHSQNIDDLERKLAKMGITTVYKYKGQTNERQGVSFKLGEDCFKGSKIDRKFSLGNLERYFSFQQQKEYTKPQYFRNSTINNHSFQNKLIEDIGRDVDSMIDDSFQFNGGFGYGGAYSEEDMRKRRKKKRKKKKGFRR